MIRFQHYYAIKVEGSSNYDFVSTQQLIPSLFFFWLSLPFGTASCLCKGNGLTHWTDQQFYLNHMMVRQLIIIIICWMDTLNWDDCCSWSCTQLHPKSRHSLIRSKRVMSSVWSSQSGTLIRHQPGVETYKGNKWGMPGKQTDFEV